MSGKKLFVAEFVSRVVIRAESRDEALDVARDLSKDEVNCHTTAPAVEDLREMPQGWLPIWCPYPLSDLEGEVSSVEDLISAGEAPYFINPPRARRKTGE
jgi:hypothetical protein